MVSEGGVTNYSWRTKLKYPCSGFYLLWGIHLFSNLTFAGTVMPFYFAEHVLMMVFSLSGVCIFHG